jgi:tellurite resistance protein
MLFLIIFGTRGVTYGSESGSFFCPCCGDSAYRHRRVRRFFTLYFIPVIPLDLLGEYVECGKCRGTYKPEVLDLELSASDADFDAEFQLATRRVMALMALADGVVDESEVEMMQRIYGDIAGKQMSLDQVRAEIEEARTDGSNVHDYVKGVVGMLNDSGKEMVVKAALLIAAADGEFQDEEQDLILSIGKALQMSPAHVNGVIAEMLSDGGEA